MAGESFILMRAIIVILIPLCPSLFNKLCIPVEVTPQPCPKYSVKTSMVVCAHMGDIMTAVANDIKMDGKTLLAHLQCEFPSMTKPQNLLELFEGLQPIQGIVKEDGCRCR